MGPPAEEDSTLGGNVTMIFAFVLLLLGALIYSLPEPEEAVSPGEDIAEATAAESASEDGQESDSE